MLLEMVLGLTAFKWILSLGLNPRVNLIVTAANTLLLSYVFTNFLYSDAIGVNTMILVWNV